MIIKNVFILTDLEGVAGVTSFNQIKKMTPSYEDAKLLLTKELNAIIRGINSFDAKIQVYLWDGHGDGGIDTKYLLPIKKYISPKDKINFADVLRKNAINVLIFVGQHAMSNSGGNLCHTMSSDSVDYYKINGNQIGEFGLWAAMAGELNVPTIFLSGDDIACAEARKLIPSIKTCEVKKTTAWESAESLPYEQVYQNLVSDIQFALKVAGNIIPFKIKLPISFEIALRPPNPIKDLLKKGGKKLTDYSVQFEAKTMEEILDRKII
jgi:D-amino peptidase